MPIIIKYRYSNSLFDDPILVSSTAQFISGVLFFGLDDYFLMKPEESDKSSEFFSSLIRLLLPVLFISMILDIKYSLIIIWVLIEVLYQMLWHFVRAESNYNRFWRRHLIVLPFYFLSIGGIYYSEHVEYLFVSGPIIFRFWQIIFLFDVIQKYWTRNWIGIPILLKFKWHFYDGVLSNFNKNIVEISLAHFSSIFVSDYYLIKRGIKAVQELSIGLLSQLKANQLSRTFSVFRAIQLTGILSVSVLVLLILILPEFVSVFSTVREYKMRWFILLLLFLPISFAYQNQLIFSSRMEYGKVFKLDAVNVIINVILVILAMKSIWLLLLGFSFRAVLSSLYTNELVMTHFRVSRITYYKPLLIVLFLTVVVCQFFLV